MQNKCECNADEACNTCMGFSEQQVDNVVDIKDPMVRLLELLQQTLGQNYVLGFVNDEGNIQYSVGEDLKVSDLLFLLESIKATYVYGLD